MQHWKTAAYGKAGIKDVSDMIYITGDTHIPADINRLSTKKFPEQKILSAEDFLIICGDFGGIWDHGSEERYWLKWLSKKRFTTLFIDGNHENHQILNEEFPITQFRGGYAHIISEKVIHLMRGQVYCIDSKKLFTLGGASSHDREYRKEGKNWWPQEMPSHEEYQNTLDNLNAHDWKVDYVITHCAPNSIQRQVSTGYEENELTCFLEGIREKLFFKKWYFGHYHVDKTIADKYICIFNTIQIIE